MGYSVYFALLASWYYLKHDTVGWTSQILFPLCIICQGVTLKLLVGSAESYLRTTRGTRSALYPTTVTTFKVQISSGCDGQENAHMDHERAQRIDDTLSSVIDYLIPILPDEDEKSAEERRDKAHDIARHIIAKYDTWERYPQVD